MSAEEDKRPDQETSELIPTTFPITPLPTNTPIITDFPSDVNPFDPAIIEQIIANLIKPLQDREGYITLPRNMPTIKERMNLILGM